MCRIGSAMYSVMLCSPLLCGSSTGRCGGHCRILPRGFATRWPGTSGMRPGGGSSWNGRSTQRRRPSMIDGVRRKVLRVIADERGHLMEILRCDDDEFRHFGQVYITTVYPGVVKAW